MARGNQAFILPYLQLPTDVFLIKMDLFLKMSRMIIGLLIVGDQKSEICFFIFSVDPSKAHSQWQLPHSVLMIEIQ
jgi:hypothetical protein